MIGMTTLFLIVTSALTAMLVSILVYPLGLHYARRHNIVDNPGARKLQRVPIPVFGGVVVYSGIVAGNLYLSLMIESPVMSWTMLAMTVMLVIGTWDDIKDLPPTGRLLVELLVVGGFILATGNIINNFHGLWGIHELPAYVSIPLSLLAGVGIINAVNLIDGVDGYASGYGMMACLFFGIMFWTVWSPRIVCMNFIVMGALLPFFMHNVFGVKSKMFIGDGGTLMLGTLMAVLVFCALTGETRSCRLETINVGMLAFTLAVLCIPVFDTLRVMTARIVRGNSPFHPDKTHLHHLFVDMGFSHLGAALFILMLNVGVVLIWFISWKMGASIDVQTYVVVALGVLVTFGFYKLMRCQQNGGPKDEDGFPQGTRLWHLMCRLGWHTHREDKRMWRTMRYLMDGPLYGGYKERIKRRLRKG